MIYTPSYDNVIINNTGIGHIFDKYLILLLRTLDDAI